MVSFFRNRFKAILIIYFLFYSSFLIGQEVKIIKVNSTEYPSVTFDLETYSPQQLKKEAFQLLENGIEVSFSVNRLKQDKTNLKRKKVLFLVEDLCEETHPGQKEFIKGVLLSSIRDIVMPGDKFNIGIFNRSHEGEPVNIIQLNNYTDNIDSIIHVINNFQSPNDIFYKQLSSDLYYSIFDGLNEINEYDHGVNKIIVVLSAGKNNIYSSEATLDRSIILSKANHIPIYSIQYRIPGWEHNRLTNIITATYGKEIVTNNVENARDSLISFLDNAPIRIAGQTYSFTYTSQSPKDGTIRIITLNINNVPFSFDHLSPKMTLFEWLSTNLYWSISIGVFVLLVIILTIAFAVRRRRKHRRIQSEVELLNEKDNFKEERIKQYSEQLLKLSNKVEDKETDRNAKDRIKKFQKLITHGASPRFIYQLDLDKITYSIFKPDIVIGRDPTCDLILPDKKISRQHCIITMKGNDFVVIDRDSANGIFVNGKKINSQIILSGDHLQIGSIDLTFLI